MNRFASFVSIIFLIVCVIGSAPAAAQQSEAAAIYKRYGEVFAAGDYAAALIEAQNTRRQSRLSGVSIIPITQRRSATSPMYISSKAGTPKRRIITGAHSR
jgi:hypothetical protein